MLNTIQLVVGDPSGDGHAVTQRYFIKTAASIEEIKDCYSRGTVKVGFDLANVCENYGDCNVHYRLAKKLEDMGMSREVFDEKNDKLGEPWREEQNDPEVGGLEFAKMWLFICVLGGLQYEIVEEENYPSIDIGGYGVVADH